MENKIRTKLIEIKKNSAITKTTMSYVNTISELFLEDITLFEYICELYGLTDDELLELLRDCDYKYIAFLDEMLHDIEEKKMSNKEDSYQLSR